MQSSLYLQHTDARILEKYQSLWLPYLNNYRLLQSKSPQAIDSMSIAILVLADWETEMRDSWDNVNAQPSKFLLLSL